MSYEVGTIVKNDLGDTLVVIPNSPLMPATGLEALGEFTRCVWVTIVDEDEQQLIGEPCLWPTELLEKV